MVRAIDVVTNDHEPRRIRVQQYESSTCRLVGLALINPSFKKFVNFQKLFSELRSDSRGHLDAQSPHRWCQLVDDGLHKGTRAILFLSEGKQAWWW